jgi:hypothetical protein
MSSEATDPRASDETAPLLGGDAERAPTVEEPQNAETREELGYDRADERSPAVHGLTIASLSTAIIVLLSRVALEVCRIHGRPPWSLIDLGNIACTTVRCLPRFALCSSSC